jgi:quinone-modifying oxidoreductase subunit QmoC
VTGVQTCALPIFGAELLRWGGMPTLGYIVYFLHLVSVMMLFLYLPYTKLAHLLYRTTAYAFEKYRESAFGKAA